MILPQRAPVVPRVIVPETGTVLPLEDEVRRIMQTADVGAIGIVGGPGSGKTRALQHLAAVLPEAQRAELLDEPEPAALSDVAKWRLVVFTSATDWSVDTLATYRLAPWGRDELIDYLLAVRKESCGAVLARLQPEDIQSLGGVPEVCRWVVDFLIYDPSIRDTNAAVLRLLEAELSDERMLERVRDACLRTCSSQNAPGAVKIPGRKVDRNVLFLLRHDSVRRILAAQHLTTLLRNRAGGEYLEKRLPRDLVRATATFIADDETVRKRLERRLRKSESQQAMAASLLHAACDEWAPKFPRGVVLSNAYLDCANWPGVRLTDAHLFRVDFSHANLEKATLYDATAPEANFRFAKLNRASLSSLNATDANFAHADLASAQARDAKFISADCTGVTFDNADLCGASFAGADLQGASFVGANLSAALFANAEIEDADFAECNFQYAVLSHRDLRRCRLDGAKFRHAQLQQCNLEELELIGADFRDADLTEALLTGSVMPGADFTLANLTRAGLADVEWKGVSLRGANLTGASFHAGSSRSGMLFTPFASEGTRTGFYTDDYDEQCFKAPEDIRKANLRGADLRDAQVDDVDFYLVDLRDAIYDKKQEQQFRQCGAILEDWNC